MTPFLAALQQGVAAGNLDSAVQGFEGIPSAEDVAHFAAVFAHAPVVDRGKRSPVAVVARLLWTTSDDLLEGALEAGLPVLHALYDRALPTATGAGGASGDDMAFVLKFYAWSGSVGGLVRVIAAGQDPRLCDEYRWPEIIETYASPEDPLHDDAIAGFSARLPRGFAGMAFLDVCNDRARAGQRAHPFASNEGAAAIAGWLSPAGQQSYAHSAAAALPFLPPEQRGPLLELALAHPDERVRLEGAWAEAASGGQRGGALLWQAAHDPRVAKLARVYLGELGMTAPALPSEQQPLAEMSEWLQHPNELGRLPDALRIFDARTLHWPPTNDVRPLWLVEWRSGSRTSVGIVGSTTFCLGSETPSTLPLPDLYGRYCAWELEFMRDPRAARALSTADGRAFLAEANPGYGF